LKRRDLLRRIAALGAKLVRHGSNHDIYGIDNKATMIPRHTEVDEKLARKIIKFFTKD